MYLKDDAALDAYLINAGLDTMLLETGDGAQRMGEDLRILIDHARRMRSLMNYVPKRYDPAIVEAFALMGTLDEALSDKQRTQAVSLVAQWLNGHDPEAQWTGQINADGSFELRRRWRDVTDVHLIDAAFVRSAEARKLQQVAAEQAENYALVGHLVGMKAAEATADDEDETRAKGSTAITRPSGCLPRFSMPAVRVCRFSVTRGWAK